MKGQKRKGSIVNYRSFAIPTMENSIHIVADKEKWTTECWDRQLDEKLGPVKELLQRAQERPAVSRHRRVDQEVRRIVLDVWEQA